MENMYPYHSVMYDEYGRPYDPDRQLPFLPGGLPNNLFPPTPSPEPGGGIGKGSPGVPSGPGGPGGPPTSPPPQQIPQQSLYGQGPQVMAVDPGAIQGCLFRFTYVWLNRYQSFWFYPTYVGRRSVAGYRWTGFNWVYFGIDLDRIQSFTCV
ncbi:hypothetical protein [Gracilibacillus sp. YIM 98692]|uniref:hypothetical protein n=1 Tax=Gracilibacillus sp. YIM 98692 TaxID=2663532 RepID=UPI0013D34E77|nr:hypothetical protein [Gracilibacillus sp. YIM 98692]